MSSGNEGCNCINQTSVLASLENRDCKTTTGKPGVYLKPFGACVSYDYGSNACLQHDLLHDPICQGDLSTATVPPYCFLSWCYVNSNGCKKNSADIIFKSEYFLEQPDIFASYSTCNSTDYFWQQYLGSSANKVSVIDGINLTAVVPDYQYPVMSKQLSDGTALWTRTADNTYYFDDTIPFGGIYIDYANSIAQLSNGDIHNVTFTHTSNGSLKRYPNSSFTAAVQDVENGLADIAVGPFWITRQRLSMTTFTVPIVYDKTVLVIPKPERNTNLGYQIQKVLEPFTYGLCLWGVLIAIIVTASLFSVWFSDRDMLTTRKRHESQLRQQQPKRSRKRRKIAYFRLIVDAILEKGMFFFSAGIEQDMGASLPHKVLMFGFGAFILIAVSAYVANLAAFLTRSGLKTEYGTMKEVIAGNVAICGHPALKDELELKWSDGNWVWPSDDDVLETYARGDCQVLALGREDTLMDMYFISKVCELGLVYTDDVIIESPIAFPVTPQLASAFSYWMYTAEKNHGLSLESAKQAFIEENDVKAECEVELSRLNMEEGDDFAQVTPGNMFLPIIFFVACALVAACLQLRHDSERKKGNASTIGRKSNLNMYSIRQAVENVDVDSDENKDMQREGQSSLDDDFAMPSSTPMVSEMGVDEDGDVQGGQICVFPGENVPGDEFHENCVSQSTLGPPESIEDMDKVNEDADTAVKVMNNGISHRIEELVESGVIEEILDCFDLFQETKKLKKDQ